MKIIFSLCILIVSFTMNCKESSVRKSFSASDSLVIHFKNEQSGTILKTVQTADPRAIGRMADFIDSPVSELYKCGFDGKMFFYKDEKVTQEVDFQVKQEACRHFAFIMEGKMMSTRMNQEAVDFLDALERGLPTYY